MGKYESFHFSPENNRSILMPRAPRGTEYHPPKRNRHRELFPPIPEDKLNHSSPYYQCNLGITEKTIVINGQERKYAIYVPDGMISKGAGIFVFPENGTNAEAFIHSENWIALAEKYHTALVVFESSQWDREQIDKEFDYAWEIITLEFVQRLTVDICESYMYVMGFGAGAEIAAAFALTYSATFAAFAADGNCAVDPELLEILGKLPSDGDLTLKKTDIAIPGFLIDRSGKAKETFEYMRTILRAKEEGLANAYGEVYLEQPERGQYYVNAQPVAQAWLGNSESVSEVSRETLNEEMIKFVLRFSRWGSFGNNCLRPMRTQEEIGVVRVEQIVEGLQDIGISMFRPDIDLEMEKSILSLWRFMACPAMQNILNVPVTGIALRKREISLYALRRHILIMTDWQNFRFRTGRWNQWEFRFMMRCLILRKCWITWRRHIRLIHPGSM